MKSLHHKNVNMKYSNLRYLKKSSDPLSFQTLSSYPFAASFFATDSNLKIYANNKKKILAQIQVKNKITSRINHDRIYIDSGSLEKLTFHKSLWPLTMKMV